MSTRAGAFLLADVASVALLAAAFQACASSPAPAPVFAHPADLERFAGTWHGEYEDPVSGRSWSIIFELKAAENEFYGDVIMTPGAGDYPRSRDADPLAAQRELRTPLVVEIRYLRIDGDSISGSLVPYWDPSCRCRVLTTFGGRLQGDVIVGTFESRAGGAESWEGTWRTVRKRR